MARVSSLEAQVLEGRAVLASAEADRDGVLSELTVARDAVGRMEGVKAEIAAAMAREEALRVEIAAQNNALKVRTVPWVHHIISALRFTMCRVQSKIRQQCVPAFGHSGECTTKCIHSQRCIASGFEAWRDMRSFLRVHLWGMCILQH